MPKTAAKWIRSTADEMAVKAGCYFDERAAAHVVDFFRKYLRHSKGKWAAAVEAEVLWRLNETKDTINARNRNLIAARKAKKAKGKA